jgi:hypothetical protein
MRMKIWTIPRLGKYKIKFIIENKIKMEWEVNRKYI